jgi:valyl-tRNA synthetase
LFTEGKVAKQGRGRAITATASQSAALAPAYSPHDVEPAIYQRWLDADVFAPDGAGSRADPAKPPFVITQPPPNITGALHMGHALTATLEDAMVRRARMQGRPTLWLPGVDHASISAQVVLDRLLAKEGQSRQSLGRERYLERMWQFINQTRDLITDQHRRLGVSVDWRRLRFTMDEGSARAVRVAFKRLYDAGLAYRGERLVNWCPGDRTSISDLEVIATPSVGKLWFVRYHLLDPSGQPSPSETISVATTRPETILGDTGVAVHPADERYAALVGRMARIPFVERDVPIIADEMVERGFGTGAVKITPAHDPDDFETGRRHNLPVIDVMTDDGHINDHGGPYRGLTREEARARIVADLDARGDLLETRQHELILGRCERSGDVVEPRLKTQWFVNVKPLANLAMGAVRDGRTEFIPRRYEKVFFEWMENIHDWNVSRQLWWGHQIPAWYCPDGHVTVSDQAGGPVGCDICGRPATELVQDEEIFDTWFSSGLWPFATLGWPDQTDDLRRYYPTTVMETGYDIIFFWVARMMMLGEWLTGEAPFRWVYLHGIVRDPYGAKMSKTKGNVVDPLEQVEELGADALRFALVHGPEPSQDQKMSRPRLEEARNFANKTWNAARFVLGARPAGVAEDVPLELPPTDLLGPAEHWILARCAATVEAADRAYGEFQFGEAARQLYDAIWSEYCDWYLEIAKMTLVDESWPAARRRATWQVLVWVLDRYLRLLHPLMPFVTEAIWQRLPHRAGDADLLMVSMWPARDDAPQRADTAAAAAVESLFEFVRAIRAARADAGVAAAEWLPARLWIGDQAARAAAAPLATALSRLARIRPEFVDRRDELATDQAAGELSVVAAAGEARLARSGTDLARERERLARELDVARAQLARAEVQLNDGNFTSKAPPAVVDAARRRANELRQRVARLAERAGQ